MENSDIMKIKVGNKKYYEKWGTQTIVKIATLKKPIVQQSQDSGEVLFVPVIIKREWEISPTDSKDKSEFHFTYWMHINNHNQYGQYGSILREKELLGLLQEAINQNFFSRNFLRQLNRTLANKEKANAKQ